MTLPLRAVLFDVDQTLLDCAGSGRKAMTAAMRRCCGVEDATAGIRFAGRTDPALVAEMVQTHARHATLTPALFQDVMEAYLSELPSLLESIGGARVLPGVVPLLEGLQAAGVLLGLATGNVARGASIKLRSTSVLDGFFSFGGYGDDHPERPGLTAVAVQRCRALTTTPLSAQQIALVGDTPADIAAGRSVGAFTVGVATGSFTETQLRACGADLVVRELTEASLLIQRSQAG